MPATNAISERSFSALKRVKTYLRSTTGEGRLNHLMLLHVHKELADSIDQYDSDRDLQSSTKTLKHFEHSRTIFVPLPFSMLLQPVKQ